MNQLKSLAESVDLMPIDLVRAAVKAVLKASKSNAGTIELPFHVTTKEEERARTSLNDAVSECLWALNLPGDDTDNLISAVSRLGSTALEHENALGLTMKQRAEAEAARPIFSIKLRAKS